jgi:outer membrane lipoprotein SlyB
MDHFKTITSRLLAPLILLLATACAAPQPPAEQSVRYGRVAQVDAVTLDADKHLGLGAILGAVAGGVLGHQIGGGTGKDVATVAGLLGGAYVGNKVQQKNAAPQAGQHIVVALNNGVAVSVTQPADPALKVGDNVYIEGNGEGARVVKR